MRRAPAGGRGAPSSAVRASQMALDRKQRTGHKDADIMGKPMSGGVQRYAKNVITPVLSVAIDGRRGRIDVHAHTAPHLLLCSSLHHLHLTVVAEDIEKEGELLAGVEQTLASGRDTREEGEGL